MLEKSLPLITIGIACYKSADTVEIAIKSALEQDWPNIEIILIDDGPCTETADVIRTSIKGHDNAKLIVHETNKGFAGALNTIIHEARGEFIAIFDDDDKSLTERIRCQYKRITEYEKEHKAGLVICHAARMQKFFNGYDRYEPTMGTGDGVVPHGTDVADRILIGKLSRGVVGSCANCSRMARTELFRKMNGYDINLRRGEDTDFNIRLALAGGHFVGIAEPLVVQTMTMGQEKTLAAERSAELLLLEKHQSYLEKIGWYEFCKEWLEIRYMNLGNQKWKMAVALAALAVRHPMKLSLKLFWAVPASATRRDFKKWHAQKLNRK